MLCSLSGTVPTEPVVCISSGYIYERRLIEKHIAAFGKDPNTGEAIDTSDLLPINSSNVPKPRTVASASVGGLLSALQSEWDGLLLEQFQLRQQLDSTRQELSQALYQHDAACRVIARLVKERDQARAALSNAQGVMAQRAASGIPTARDESMSSIPSVLSEEIVSTLKDKGKELSKWRKKRNVTDALSLEMLKTFKPVKSISSIPGATISAFTYGTSNVTKSSVLVNGYSNGVVQVIEATSGSVLRAFGGSSSAVLSCAYNSVNDSIIVGDVDGNVRFYSSSASNENPLFTANLKKGGVMNVSVHPSNSIIIVGTIKGDIITLDINTLEILSSNNQLNASSFSAALHPDGLLYAIGCGEETVKIIDLRSMEVAGSLTVPNSSDAYISELSMSENGYHLVSVSSKGVVSLWDLRTLSRVAVLGEKSGGKTTQAVSASVDVSGLIVACGRADGTVSLFSVKDAIQACSSGSESAGALAILSTGKNSVDKVAFVGQNIAVVVSDAVYLLGQ